MSKGTKIIPVRVSKQIENEINEAIISRNNVTREACWTRSDFIRQAINDKLAHIRRSRKKVPPSFVDDVRSSLEGKS